MRLEGKAKGGYFPTPEPVLARIANFLKVENYQLLNMMDPCCGTGRALAFLGDVLRKRTMYRQEWNSIRGRMQDTGEEVDNKIRITTYGIELEGVRAKIARSVLDEVLQASYFSTTISQSAFGLVLDNAPYDLDYESGDQGGRTRLEVTFAKRTTLKLMTGGIHIAILPQHVLPLLARHWSENYKDVTCYRFPDEEWLSPEDKAAGKTHGTLMFELFNQVVLFGVKKGFVSPDREMEKQILEWANMGVHLPILPHETEVLEGNYTVYTVPREWDENKVKSFAATVFDPDRIASAICAYKSNGGSPRQGVWSSREYAEDHWPAPTSTGVAIGTPLAPLKHGHLAVLAAAGIANGAELVGKDRRLLIKGYSGKVTVTKTEEDEDNVTVTKTDKFVTALWGVDLDTGDLVYIETSAQKEQVPGTEGEEGEAQKKGVAHETMTLAAFMENFGTALTEQVARANPPLFWSEKEQLPWANDRFKQLLRRPLGRQRDFILFMVNALVNGKREEDVSKVAKIAEMATGKTFLSLAMSYIADEQAPCYPMIVLCPPILGRKWKREAEDTVPGVKAVLVRQLSTEKDASEFRQFDPTFMGKELSSVGCLERTIAVIKKDLAEYEAALSKWEEERLLRKRARKHWKATVWWEWKQKYVEGAQINPAEPHPPEFYPLWKPKPVKPLHIVIITSSVAKLGTEWEPVYQIRPLKVVDDEGKTRLMKELSGEHIVVPHCTSCGEPLYSGKKPKEDASEDENAEVIDTSEYLQERDLLGGSESRKKRWCLSCGNPLWQVSSGGTYDGILKSTARRRVALADYIRKRHKRFFQLLVSDEIHEGAEGTALFYARASLQEACVRSSGLTGTLCNGYASSVFPTFYGINPDVRRDFCYDDTKRWVDFFGIWQEVRKTSKKGDDGFDGAQSKRKVGKPQVSEKPGFSPQGLKYVLSRAAFLELSDVAPWLPKFTETVIEVPMDDMLAKAYRKFEDTITHELAGMLVCGDMSGLSPWFHALLGYPSMPYLEGGWVCKTKYGRVLGIAEELPEQHVYTKERELIDLVQEEVSNGRRVMVYCEHTGQFDIPSRLKKLLQHNVKLHRPLLVSKLYADTVKTIDREQWLRDEVGRGCDVLLCNPRLVKVGLDLIEFPTIVFFEVPMSTSDMRQASRRSYRPGQKLPVKVVYMVYPTMEYRMLTLMANKMRTSLAVEGQLPGEGLVSFGASDDDTSNVMLKLAREVMATIKDGKESGSDLGDAGSLQAMFTSVAQAEYDQNTYVGVEIGEEPMRVPVELITTRTLSVASYPGIAEIEVVEVVREKPKQEEVVIIPISRITDPWEALRVKIAEQKGAKRKKKVAKPTQVGTDLWGFSKSDKPEPVVVESTLFSVEEEEELLESLL